jgi:hypothetical protein
MNKIEQIQSIDKFILRLHLEEDQYESRKIEQLLDAYKDQLVAEIKVDAVITDINAGAFACAASCTNERYV